MKPVSASRSVLVHWMGIADINSAGYVHGGTVMKLCDEVAGLASIRHSQQRVVTGGADRMTSSTQRGWVRRSLAPADDGRRVRSVR